MPVKYFESTDTTVEMKDTTKLQKTSLDLFAQQLGYEWCDRGGHYKPITSVSFFHTEEYDAAKARGMLSISLIKMQSWYNCNFKNCTEDYPWHGSEIYLADVSENLGFTVPQLRKAVNAKLIITTHLQYSKKFKVVLCTDHQIKIKE